MGYVLTFAISLTVCFGFQTWALVSAGGTTTKSESNFHSSLARIQAATRAPHAEVFLLGSSRTGRMPDRNSGFPEVANLGCDGGNAAITLRAIDRGILPTPAKMVIEGNTLMFALESSGEEVSSALESPWFRIGKQIPNLGANARPAALAYSLLLSRRYGEQGTGLSGDFPNAPEAGMPETKVALEGPASEVVLELSAIIGRMRDRGCEALIVQIPPGAPSVSLIMQIPIALSQASATPFLDLTKDLPPGAVTYTDGIHMAPASAAAALRSILTALEKP